APRTQGAIGWPSLIETLLALAAIAALIQPFHRLASDDTGRDRRFADIAISVGGLPEHVLPAPGASYRALARPRHSCAVCILRRPGRTAGARSPVPQPRTSLRGNARGRHATGPHRGVRA